MLGTIEYGEPELGSPAIIPPINPVMPGILGLCELGQPVWRENTLVYKTSEHCYRSHARIINTSGFTQTNKVSYNCNARMTRRPIYLPI